MKVIGNYMHDALTNCDDEAKRLFREPEIYFDAGTVASGRIDQYELFEPGEGRTAARDATLSRGPLFNAMAWEDYEAFLNDDEERARARKDAHTREIRRI